MLISLSKIGVLNCDCFTEDSKFGEYIVPRAMSDLLIYCSIFKPGVHTFLVPFDGILFVSAGLQ